MTDNSTLAELIATHRAEYAAFNNGTTTDNAAFTDAMIAVTHFPAATLAEVRTKAAYMAEVYGTDTDGEDFAAILADLNRITGKDGAVVQIDGQPAQLIAGEEL